MELLCLIRYGRLVATTLFSDDMNKNWLTKFFCLGKGSLHGSDVMSIDRANIFQTKIFKHSLRSNDVLDALLHAMQSFVDRRTNNGSLREDLLAPIQETFISLGYAKS
jgi:hypothetical protein